MAKAKKKKKIGDQTSEGGVGAPTPEEATGPEHWTLERWGRFRRYQCRYCPFDSLNEVVIQEHYLASHARGVAGAGEE